MKFCADARFCKSLALSGVDVASLTNNHTLNYGWKGLFETEKHLSDAAILSTGFKALEIPADQTSAQSSTFSNYPIITPLLQNITIAQNCVKNYFLQQICD